MKTGGVRNCSRSARNRLRGRCALPRVRRLWFEVLEERRVLAVVTPYDIDSSPSLLTAALVPNGTGLTIESAIFTGETGQAGIFAGFNFNDGTTSLILPDGIILTTGEAEAVDESDATFGASTDWDNSGDSDLEILIGTTTNDAAALTIEFTVTSETQGIEFEFVFGSEEFPEFVGSFNDVFAVYLDDEQICFDPDGQPITVNNNYFLLNNSGDSSDPDTIGKTPVTFNVEYDGLTPRLVTQATLDPAITVHTLKFVIADASDGILDSGVFLANLHGIESDGGGTGQPPTASAGGDYSVDAGSSIQLDASASSDPNQVADTLIYQWDLDGDDVFGETGAAANRGDEVGASPSFVATGLQSGDYIVKLLVTDSTQLVDADEATVTVNKGLPPNNVTKTSPTKDALDPDTPQSSESENDDESEVVETAIKLPPPTLTVLQIPAADAGSGGQLLNVPAYVTSSPQGGAAPLDLVREELSESPAPVTDEIVDAVYELAEIELVTLVGYDMGDEPVLRKKVDQPLEPVPPPQDPDPVPHDVYKPTSEDSSWGPLVWTALAGGGTLWLGGAWWWRGHRRNRRYSGEITG